MLEKKIFFLFYDFFLLKEKNTPTIWQGRAPYFWNFCKIWVSRNISMFRRVRSICRRKLYVNTEGTEIANIKNKNHNFICILSMFHHSQISAKMAIFSKQIFAKTYMKNPFETRKSLIAFSNFI